MKKTVHVTFTFLLLSFFSIKSIAQQKLIHYWHFNNLSNFTTVAVSPSTFPSIKADYSSLDTNKAVISYVPLSGTSGNVKTFWDYVSPGDTVNARLSKTAGLGFRPRNPSDSMQLVFYIPSTNYQNITIKFETQKSSAGNGASVDTFSYSLDSGSTWKTSGLSSITASNGSGSWTTSPGISVNISNDASANNNSQLVFRIKFGGGGTTGTSGNVRFDNITVEGDTITTLPVQLINFNAIVESENKIVIKWQTASEIDNDHFTVERSFDEKVWEEFSNIKGAGNANMVSSYQITDQIESTLPLVYYRLKQVDKNGIITKFNPIAVTLKNNFPNIISIENPITDNTCKINITSGKQTDLIFLIKNIFGEVLQSTTHIIYKGNNNVNIDVNNLNSGIYFVELKNETTTLSVKKIVK